MKVRFGVLVSSGSIFPNRDDLAKFDELIKVIDGCGVEMIGTSDTSFIHGDAYVRTTLMAQAAENALVGIHPTNPITREPQIMAGFLASIDAMTNGRAFMDIATGDSAVYNIGYKASTRAQLEDYINCVRELLSKGRVELSRTAATGTLARRDGKPAYSHHALRRRTADAASGRSDL